MSLQSVFISYSTADQIYADKIRTFLADNGISVWIATQDIGGGESFANEITKAIANSKVFVFVLSENSNKSPHCGNELSMAFSSGKKIIPYRLHDFELSNANTYFLQQAQWIDATQDEEKALRELLDKVNSALGQEEIDLAPIKIITAEEKQIENYLKRAYLALGEKDFEGAEKFAESILNINMECAEAYLVKTLCDLKMTTPDKIKTYQGIMIANKNFEYALQFAKGDFLETLKALKWESEHYFVYKSALEMVKEPFDYDLVSGMLDEMKGYKPIDKLLKNLPSLYDQRIVEKVFDWENVPYFQNVHMTPSNNESVAELEAIEKLYRSKTKSDIKENYYGATIEAIQRIKDEELREKVMHDYELLYSLSSLYLDAKYDECIEKLDEGIIFSCVDSSTADDIRAMCKSEKNFISTRREEEERKIQEKRDREEREKQARKEEEEKKKQENKDIAKSMILTCMGIVAIVVAIIFVVSIFKQGTYDEAKALMSEHRYEEAMEKFRDLDYMDSSEMFNYCEYMAEGDYGEIVDKYNLTEFVIPEGVTEIKNSTFYNCTTLTKITLPSTLKKIGEDAFYNCKALTSVNIPDSVTSIGKYAFDTCLNLKTVSFGNSSKLKTIGAGAFLGCEKLESIKIPSGVTVIDTSTFNTCKSLKEVVLHDKLEEIEDFAFKECISLTKIIIPNNVSNMGSCVFQNCSSLTIYCRIDSKPSDWYWNWNYSKCKEVWGYTGN